MCCVCVIVSYKVTTIQFDTIPDIHTSCIFRFPNDFPLSAVRFQSAASLTRLRKLFARAVRVLFVVCIVCKREHSLATAVLQRPRRGDSAAERSPVTESKQYDGLDGGQLGKHTILYLSCSDCGRYVEPKRMEMNATLLEQVMLVPSNVVIAYANITLARNHLDN